MNNLKIFESNEFGKVRTTVINNEVYFSLNDVCRILEIKNPSQAKKRLNTYGVISNEVGVVTGTKSDVAIHDGRQNRKQTIINESGLYSLIFSSKMEKAKEFKGYCI